MKVWSGLIAAILGGAFGSMTAVAGEDASVLHVALRGLLVGTTLGICVATRERRRAHGARLASTMGVSFLVVLVAVPFHDELSWVDVSRGTPVEFDRQCGDWEATIPHRRVAYFNPRGRAPSSRVEARVEDATRFAALVLHYRFAHTERTTIDRETGAPLDPSRTAYARFLVERGGVWSEIETVRLRSEEMCWSREIRIEVPEDSQRVGIEWLVGGGPRAEVALAETRRPEVLILGLPRWSFRALGDTLALGASLWLLLFPMLAVIDVVGRLLAEPARRTPGARPLRLWPWLAFAVLASAMIPAAWIVAPWLRAATTPVLVDLDLPPESGARLRFGPEPDEVVELVRVDLAPSLRRLLPGRDSYAVLGAELPPRPSYDLSIEFPEDVSSIAFRGLALLDTRRPLRIEDAFEPRQDLWETDRGARMETGSGLVVHAPSGGILRLIRPVGSADATATEVFEVWGFMSGALLILTLFTLAFLRTVPTPGHRPRSAAAASLVWAAGSVLVLRVLLSFAAPYVVHDDTASYLVRSFALMEDGTLYHGGHSEMVRLPGYSAFSAAVMKLAGPNLRAVVLAQEILFVLGVLALSWSLRRWVPRTALICGIFAAGLLPSQIFWSRFLLTETVFSGLCLLAVAAYVESLGAERRGRMRWLTAFAVAGTLATMVRPNGVIVFGLPALQWLSFVIAGCGDRERSAARRIARIAAQGFALSLPVLVVGCALLGWCYRNEARTGYFALTSTRGINVAFGLSATGSIDPRALEDSELYEQFVRWRLERGRWMFGVAYEQFWFRRAVERKSIDPGLAFLREMDGEFRSFTERNRGLLPWPARLVRFARGLGFQTLGSENYIDRPGEFDYAGFEAGSSAEAALERRFGPLSRESVAPGPAGDLMRRLAGLQGRFRAWWLGLTILAGLICLRRGSLVLALPTVLILANLVLLGELGIPSPRYMDAMDAFAVFQFVSLFGLRSRGATEAAPATAG